MDEYLRLEATSEERWEYAGGEAFAMAATPEHNLVKRNALVGLLTALEAGPCVPYPDGQKLATGATGAYHYPDVSVYCDPPERDPRDPNAFTNPTLLVEVLSPTTADYDHGAKFAHYRTLPSLHEYLVIDPEARTLTRYRKLDGGDWLMSPIDGGEVELSSLGVTLDVAPLWRDMNSLMSP